MDLGCPCCSRPLAHGQNRLSDEAGIERRAGLDLAHDHEGSGPHPGVRKFLGKHQGQMPLPGLADRRGRHECGWIQRPSSAGEEDRPRLSCPHSWQHRLRRGRRRARQQTQAAGTRARPRIRRGPRVSGSPGSSPITERRDPTSWPPRRSRDPNTASVPAQRWRRSSASCSQASGNPVRRRSPR